MRQTRAGEPMLRSGIRHQQGVTLIEMIVVIVVSGILISITGMLVRNQVEAYVDVARRAELSDIADGVLRRIARDVQGSVPNSLRPSSSDSSFIELVPIVNAGRFASQETAVLVSPLTLQGPAISVAANQELVICNTGHALADLYAGNNRRALGAGSSLTSLTFSGGALTDYCSSNRYQVIDKTVVYALEAATRSLWRFSGCTVRNVQPTTIADLTTNCTVKAMAAGNVASASFNFAANVLPSLGILTVRLVLSSVDAPGERVTLLHQINVLNSP